MATQARHSLNRPSYVAVVVYRVACVLVLAQALPSWMVLLAVDGSLKPPQACFLSSLLTHGMKPLRAWTLAAN